MWYFWLCLMMYGERGFMCGKKSFQDYHHSLEIVLLIVSEEFRGCKLWWMLCTLVRGESLENMRYGSTMRVIHSFSLKTKDWLHSCCNVLKVFCSSDIMFWMVKVYTWSCKKNDICIPPEVLEGVGCIANNAY